MLIALAAAGVVIAVARLVVQITPEIDPTGFLATWWPAIAAVLPFVLAVITRADAQAKIKQAIAIILSVAAVGVGLAALDWSTITPELVAGRIVATIVLAEATYRVLDQLVAGISPAGIDFNRLPFFAPSRGIG